MSRYQVSFLKSLVWFDLGLNPGLPDHWQALYPLDQWAGFYIYINILYIYIKVVKLATVIKSDPNIPFSSATTFSRLLRFTLDAQLIMLKLKQWEIKYHSLSFWYDDLVLNPGFPNTGMSSFSFFFISNLSFVISFTKENICYKSF